MKVGKSLVYENPMGRVLQCDQNSCLTVEFNGLSENLNYTCFLCLKRAADKVSLEEMAYNTEEDIEIVTSCGSERCYVLSLTEAYFFKDLLCGAKVMLELNSIFCTTGLMTSVDLMID